MTLIKRNMLSGFSIVLVALILYSQTLSMGDAFLTEGIHPMDYPRVLIGLLAVLGFIIAFKPSASACSTGEHIAPITSRTPLMLLALSLYALLFVYVGFYVSSVVGASCCALVMGWKRCGLLLLVNLVGVACIWLLFTYALKIPLPVFPWW
ncbi:tripartite tricarboxylate transporter TctB family protein [Desulfovibrio cuneatus]|uniref:tripartite tricarboxylate transporter TctB family protein n=1 Tax=Desulfovibrio cuneatus TaxID=159728 RepID=UPI0004140F62|nr:tripartite tricarboxylate transporter TctB family protein [Desulfovibrio cuneatus]